MTQVLEAGLSQEAEAVKYDLLIAHSRMRNTRDEIEKHDQRIKTDALLSRLFEIRELGALPFGMDVSLTMHSVEGNPEDLHEFSCNPVTISFPKLNDPDNPTIVATRLRYIKRQNDPSNSLDSLGLISPYNISESTGTEIFPRTLKEIKAIDKARDDIPKGQDVERRRELRELKDRLVIERLLKLIWGGNIPKSSKAFVELIEGGIQIMILQEGSTKTKVVIEGVSDRYSDLRNEKLTNALRRLGLAA